MSRASCLGPDLLQGGMIKSGWGLEDQSRMLLPLQLQLEAASTTRGRHRKAVIPQPMPCSQMGDVTPSQVCYIEQGCTGVLLVQALQVFIPSHTAQYNCSLQPVETAPHTLTAHHPHCPQFLGA